MQRKELILIGLTLLISIACIGTVTGFDFVTITVIQFHDTYIEIHPIHFAAMLWLIFTFLTFLVMATRNRFSEKADLWVLVISNSILITLAAAFTYFVYAFFVTYLLIDIFRDVPQTEMITNQMDKALTAGICTFGVFLVSEYFLIRRLIQLKRTPTQKPIA
jgi:hypothetical protein